MDYRTLPRIAVGAGLRFTRLPVDGVLRIAGSSGTGPAASAKLALDRADALARDLWGFALRDDQLHEDAARRREAADERERAIRLRAGAQAKAERADQRFAERRDQAQQRRQSAAQRTRAQRERARETREQATERARQSAARRREASHAAERRTEEVLEHQEREARLSQLETEDEALERRDEALTAADEARRLADAAARAKAERKSDE